MGFSSPEKHRIPKFHFIYCPAGEKKKKNTGKPKARDVFLEGKNVPLHRKHLDVLFYYNFDSDILHIAQLNKQKKILSSLKKTKKQLISVII